MFECGTKTAEECAWYKHRWHFWYVADYVFALPTVAFFMSGIGVFVVAYVISRLFLRQRKAGRGVLVRKVVAGSRYLAYRGFHVRRLKWNSAPVGVLLLGAAGVVFFFCKEPFFENIGFGYRVLTFGNRYGPDTATVLLG